MTKDTQPNGSNGRGVRSLFHSPRLGIVLSLCLAAVCIIVSARTCSTPVSHVGYDYAPGSGDTVNVAIDYSPMSLYRQGDSIGGFNYEMIKMMAAQHGHAVKFFPVADLSEALADMKRGRYDIVASDFPVTERQREGILFTDPVYLDRQVLVTRDSTINTALDLRGKEVWALPGTAARERLENLSREIGGDIHIKGDSVKSAEQLFMLASMGKIPAAVVNKSFAERLVKDYPEGADYIRPVSMTQFQGWAVRDDRPELADTLNARIAQFKTTPAYHALVEKYVAGGE